MHNIYYEYVYIWDEFLLRSYTVWKGCKIIFQARTEHQFGPTNEMFDPRICEWNVLPNMLKSWLSQSYVEYPPIIFLGSTSFTNLQIVFFLLKQFHISKQLAGSNEEIRINKQPITQ